MVKASTPKPSKAKHVIVRTVPADAGPAGKAAAAAYLALGYDDLGGGRFGATDKVFEAAHSARVALHAKRMKATQTGESV